MYNSQECFAKDISPVEPAWAALHTWKHTVDGRVAVLLLCDVCFYVSLSQSNRLYAASPTLSLPSIVGEETNVPLDMPGLKIDVKAAAFFPPCSHNIGSGSNSRNSSTEKGRNGWLDLPAAWEKKVTALTKVRELGCLLPRVLLFSLCWLPSMQNWSLPSSSGPKKSISDSLASEKLPRKGELSVLCMFSSGWDWTDLVVLEDQGWWRRGTKIWDWMVLQQLWSWSSL